MELINNTTKTLKNDLSVEIKQGSKLSIAAACFSIYAFQELKEQLSQIEQLRFIFTSPTFVTEKAKKERREFYIPRLTRERSLYGTEFEIKLRNELTQKAIARECAEWIRQKVTFKSNVSDKSIQGQIVVDSVGYTPINNFTTVELGCEKGNVISTTIVKDESLARTLLADFNEIWNDSKVLQVVTDEVIDSITAAYNENSPDFIYFVTLYNIFNEFLEDVSEDVLPNEATGFKESKIWGMLYNFQKDAALAIINKLEKYNGCILADSVGLGKTFTALAVIKYYENRNKSVLVLCPKKLTNNWNTYKDNYVNNPIAADRLRYDVLYHTDLNRTHGTSNGLDLDRLNWGNYDLVVIDESHNFRNGGKLVENPDEDAKDNRYVTLMKKVIRAGVKTKVLMLSATPVNNRFNDLKNQLALAYEGHTDYIDEKLNTTRSIDEIFRNAQRAFNTWSKWEPCDRTTENLLKMLDFDFFEVLDSVTIARSRKHIQKYYDMADIGTFPTRLKPISLRPHLTDLKEAISYNEIFEQLMLLTLTIYTPTHYILPSKMEKYAELYGDNRVNVGFTQANREQGIRRLTAINLMKRMESSVYSFNLTLTRIKDLINSTIETIDRFDNHSGTTLDLTDISDMDEFDVEDQNSDELFSFGRKVKIDLADMDYVSWRDSLKKDAEVLELLTLLVGDITPEHDSKLQELFRVIDNKITHPINEGNKKLIIFTAFADTAGYLYDNVSRYVKDRYGLNTAMVSGSVEGRTTCPKLRADLNTVLTCFSPISKDKELLMPGDKTEIDVLIATDCISEGQNLQDCDYLINYDIHWNPVRIIQRFGRIDRIGSRNKVIQLVNFWPDVTLDDYINLKAKVETRMKIVDMTATGDDNLLSDEEKTDLEYRKAQLKRLQDEVVDIEDKQIILSSKKPPMAKIELEIGYNKSINRETRILSVGDDLYFVSQEMEQYKGYTISEIDPLRGTVTFTNGEVIKAGDVVGDVSEKDMRRIQIRETILSHFEKEEKLFNMGIKCLSLFFIDEVAKYRQYDENGDEVLGEYGVMFEQEYLAILNEYITMFDTPYQKYLKSTCSDVSRVHKGYFSIDKKTGRSVDSQLKRGSEFSDDISAYDLILKNKERLLSFDEPTRFIFSHSALREGWDNPNVFQICTLKHSDSNTAKRQEVGRGLRLCVNQDGNRMDAQSCGDSVHEINTLTVVASESYKTFVTDLQSDIKTVLYDRPTVATSEYFKGKYVKVDDVPTLIDDEKANAIEFYLIQNGYVDMKRKVTDKYRQDVKNGTVAELPDELKPMTDGIHTLIQAVYDDSVLKDMFSDGHETKVKDNPLNENFAKKEFQALWREINHKYAYTVDFDSAELIRNAIAHIDKKLFVSELQYTTTIGRQKAEMNEYEIERGDSFTGEKTRTQTLKHAEASQIKYDLIGKIAEGTVLTRRTVSAILQGIRVDKLYMFRNNPEEFISKVIRLINEQKATMIVEHISYDTIEGEYDSSIFTAEKATQSFDKAFLAKKAIQDYVFTDGSADKSIERKFAEDLDAAEEVCVYAKLPRTFQIPTPVGNYSPDWAIAFYEGTVKHIFFIAETKGTMESLELRPIEQAKISCAKKLFNEMSTSNVVYHDVDSYRSLLSIMSSI